MDGWGDLQHEARQLGERADKEAEDPRLGRRGGRRRETAREDGESKEADPASSGAVEDEEEGGPGARAGAAVGAGVDTNAPASKPPRAAAAGWGDAEGESKTETVKAGGGKARRTSAALDETSAAAAAASAPKGRNASKHHDDRDETGDIMIIPDLDEEAGERSSKVAVAPQHFRAVQSLHELDRAISGLQLPVPSAASEQRLDLSILSSVLIPRDKLVEPDEAWEFEQLLEQVSQEMTKQKENQDEFAAKTKAAQQPAPTRA
jgi:hypothetical protein